MHGLVFAQSVNMAGRCDAKGAFVPGARRFVHKHNLDAPVWLDDTNDRATMIGGIASGMMVDAIAYFGHGTRSSLPSANIQWRHLPALAEAIQGAAAPGCQVVLYACSAGQAGCFANQLAKLLDYKVTVWGHTCVGHSFTNPFVTRFPYEGDSPFLIEPGGPLWRAWYRLIESGSDVWTRFPFMTHEELEAEIGAAA